MIKVNLPINELLNIFASQIVSIYFHFMKSGIKKDRNVAKNLISILKILNFP